MSPRLNHGSGLIALVLALLPGRALAFDIDLWRPGASSANTGDAVTAPSAWSLGTEQTSFRLAYGWGTSVLQATSEGQGASLPQDVFDGVGTVALVGERGLAPRWSVGGRVRTIAHAAATGLPFGVLENGSMNFTDLAVWSHHSRAIGEHFSVAVAPELRLDRRSGEDEPPSAPSLSMLSGTGTGAALPVSVGWMPGGAGGPWRVHAALSPGFAVADDGALPTPARLSTDAWLAGSYALSERIALLGEGFVQTSAHGWEAEPFTTWAPILRAGARLTPTPSWSVLGVLSSSGSAAGRR